MILGAYFHDVVMQNVLAILVAAVLLVIRPTIAYFKDLQAIPPVRQVAYHGCNLQLSVLLHFEAV
jgi:hypothetical protein